MFDGESVPTLRLVLVLVEGGSFSAEFLDNGSESLRINAVLAKGDENREGVAVEARLQKI
jgi:hypothetical protein